MRVITTEYVFSVVFSALVISLILIRGGFHRGYVGIFLLLVTTVFAILTAFISRPRWIKILQTPKNILEWPPRDLLRISLFAVFIITYTIFGFGCLMSAQAETELVDPKSILWNISELEQNSDIFADWWNLQNAIEAAVKVVNESVGDTLIPFIGVSARVFVAFNLPPGNEVDELCLNSYIDDLIEIEIWTTRAYLVFLSIPFIQWVWIRQSIRKLKENVGRGIRDVRLYNETRDGRTMREAYSRIRATTGKAFTQVLKISSWRSKNASETSWLELCGLHGEILALGEYELSSLVVTNETNIGVIFDNAGWENLAQSVVSRLTTIKVSAPRKISQKQINEKLANLIQDGIDAIDSKNSP